MEGRPVTEKEWETLSYRRMRLNNKLDQLRGILSARWGSAAESVRRDGRFSQEAAEETVAALLSARAAGVPIDRQFYGDLLYCSLRVLEGGTGWMGWTGGKRWEDLLELVEQFPILGQTAYQALTGDCDSPWEGEEEIGLTEEEELQASLEAGLFEPATGDFEEEERLRERERDDWREKFQEKEEFCARYCRCREAGRKKPHWHNVLHTVEDMVDAYLFDRGLSGFLSDELYFLAYGFLDKAQRQLRAMRETEG